MKWFSLDTNLINDDKIEDLLFRHGAEGYAVYIHLLERISKEIDIDNENNGYINGLETIGRIAHTLYIQPEKLSMILDTCSLLQLIDKNEWENGRIYIPKILERKQIKEYLRSQEAGKRGAEKRWNDSTPNSPPISTPNKAPNGYLDIDKDIEKDKEVGKELNIEIDQHNINKEKKREKEIKLHSCEERRSSVLSDLNYDVCKGFMEYLREYHANRLNSILRGKEDWQIYEQWLNDIRILSNKGYGEDKILKAIKFAIDDNFWREQFYSISKLNKKNKNGVLYIDEFLHLSKEKISDKEQMMEWLNDE